MATEQRKLFGLSYNWQEVCYLGSGTWNH